jgi:hypothetical protein
LKWLKGPKTVAFARRSESVSSLCHDVTMVTVYRSMDATAKEDCEIIISQLTEEGLSPVIVDDSEPGVPEGVYEVRVPDEEERRAEELIAANPLPDEVEEVDNSADLDLETIYRSEGITTGEMEATGIKNVLEASGIAAVIVGDSVLPNLGFEVRVPRDEVAVAKELIAEAQSAGAAAADEAEQQTESSATDLPRPSR